VTLGSAGTTQCFVTKLLPSCYQGVTLCLQNRRQSVRCPSPFPFITPGASGFRSYVKVGRFSSPQDYAPAPEMLVVSRASSRASRVREDSLCTALRNASERVVL
jgi:hypothetical protein